MLIWLTGADGWMRYWTGVSSQGSSRAEFVIRETLDTLLGHSLPLAVLSKEGVGQVEMRVVSLVPGPLIVLTGQVREAACVGVVEAEEAVVGVQPRQQPGVERGWQTVRGAGEARPRQRSGRRGGAEC